MERTRKKRSLSTTMLKTVTIFSVLLQFHTILLVSADWGMIPVMPEVSVYEPGQKAILAWNGQEEILILTADVTATVNTTVLQILPLPSNPLKIEQTSSESFYVVEELIWYHRPPPPPWGYLGNETDEVRVVFHEKIGMHDITVVEAYDVSEFTEWMDEFLLKNGISQQVSLEDFHSVIEDYLVRDFHFYVLDLLALSSDQKSVEPILYQFDTSFLYYPLLITSPIGGDGKIILFLLTEDPVDSGYHPLRKARYYGTADIVDFIEFEVSHEELSLIDPLLGELLDDTAWMTALVYEGPLGTLTEDMMLTLLLGDLNVDGRVDIHDLWVAAQAFSSSPGHPRWIPKADLDNNGVVNIIDIYVIATHFGKTREQPQSVAGTNADLQLNMTVERVHVDIGTSVNITLTLKNLGNKTLMLQFRSSQDFDLYLYYHGVPVAKHSDGMAFLMYVWELYLALDETYTRTLNWNFYLYTPSTGERYPPPPGTYALVGVSVGYFRETSPAVTTSGLALELS